MAKLEIWVAYNEDGAYRADVDCAGDASTELIDAEGGEVIAVVKLTVTVPDLTIPQTEITVEEKDVSISAQVEAAE